MADDARLADAASQPDIPAASTASAVALDPNPEAARDDPAEPNVVHPAQEATAPESTTKPEQIDAQETVHSEGDQSKQQQESTNDVKSGDNDGLNTNSSDVQQGKPTPGTGEEGGAEIEATPTPAAPAAPAAPPPDTTQAQAPTAPSETSLHENAQPEPLPDADIELPDQAAATSGALPEDSPPDPAAAKASHSSPTAAVEPAAEAAATGSVSEIEAATAPAVAELSLNPPQPSAEVALGTAPETELASGVDRAATTSAAAEEAQSLTQIHPYSAATKEVTAEATLAAQSAEVPAPAPAPEPAASALATTATTQDEHPPSSPSSPPPATASPVPLMPHFVAPSSYLRPKTSHRPLLPIAVADINTPPAMALQESQPRPPLGPHDKEQIQGLKAIRDFLKVRTSYDVLPLSFRLIVLDTQLLIEKSLNILIQNSIVSAPLWDSQRAKFAGILTSTDFLNVIQYYCQFPDEMGELSQFRLSSLRAIEKAIGAIPIETLSVHPSRPLYEACRSMLSTRARRIPLVDVDEETGQEMVVSVITQYRILKFIAVNNEHNTIMLKKSVREIGLGSYGHIATASMNSTVHEAVRVMVDKNISCIPIVDKEGVLLNVFEAVDIIPCIKGGAYEELDGTIGDALCKRSDDSPGIYTCSQEDRLESIFDTIRKSRVHRLIVVDDDNKLKGIISLSDILKYVLLYGEEDSSIWR